MKKRFLVALLLEMGIKVGKVLLEMEKEH